MTDERNEVSRREFASRTAVAAAAVMAVGNRVLGANDRVVVASIGIRGQGNSLKRGFAKLKGVEIKTLCDIDENLAAERINDKALADVPTFKPGFQQDLRRVLDDKDIDGVIIATPNHWHALATIWALQAGKHVYVEKPASHTRLGRAPDGRAPRAKYKKIVQVGTMNRSRPAVRQAIQFIHDGGIGNVYMARGPLLQAAPRHRQVSRRPDAAGREVPARTSRRRQYEPTYDSAYLAKVDYDLWLGPAPQRPFNRNRFHYNWHWHWDYGNGDTGNQGPHQFDIARWGLGKNEHPVKVRSVGGYFGEPASQETPDLQTTRLRVRGRQGPGVRHPRRLHERRRHPEDRQPLLRHQGLGLDRRRRPQVAVLSRPQGREGPGLRRSRPARAAAIPNVLTSIETPHYQNFVDAIRAGDPKVLTCDILEGHLSSTLPHLANISYRVGRSLTFDGKTETCVGDAEANKLLTREYRKGFVIPATV